MSLSDLERLLWERVDGTLEGADAEELRRRMAVEPDAKRLEEEIGRLASRLDAVEEIPVPGDLGDGIRRAVRAASPPSAPRAATGWAAGLARLLGPQPARRLVYAAATLVVALVGYQLVSDPVERFDGPFEGTAGLPEPDSAIPAVQLELPDDRGELTISRRPGGVDIELRTTPALGNARLLITGADLRIHRTGRRGDATFELIETGRGPELAVAGVGVVELGLATGAGTREVTFSVTADGESLTAHTLTLDPGGDG